MPIVEARKLLFKRCMELATECPNPNEGNKAIIQKYDKKVLALIYDITVHTKTHWPEENHQQRVGSLNNIVRLSLLLSEDFMNKYNSKSNIFRNINFLAQYQITGSDIKFEQRLPITENNVNSILKELIELMNNLFFKLDQIPCPILDTFTRYGREKLRISKMLETTKFAGKLNAISYQGKVALLRQLQIIGQLGQGDDFSEATKELVQDIDWQLLIDLSNKLAHAQSDIPKGHLANCISSEIMRNVQAELTVIRISLQKLQLFHNQIDSNDPLSLEKHYQKHRKEKKGTNNRMLYHAAIRGLYARLGYPGQADNADYKAYPLIQVKLDAMFNILQPLNDLKIIEKLPIYAKRVQDRPDNNIVSEMFTSLLKYYSESDPVKQGEIIKAIEEIRAYSRNTKQYLHIEIDADIKKVGLENIADCIFKYSNQCKFYNALLNNREAVEACFFHMIEIENYITVLRRSADLGPILPTDQELKLLKSYLYHDCTAFEAVDIEPVALMTYYAAFFKSKLLPKLEKLSELYFKNFQSEVNKVLSSVQARLFEFTTGNNKGELFSINRQESALHVRFTVACQNGNIRRVEKILKTGINVNYVCNNTTPLYVACQNGHFEIAKLLLEYGADTNFATKDRVTQWKSKRGQVKEEDLGQNIHSTSLSFYQVKPAQSGATNVHLSNAKL